MSATVGDPDESQADSIVGTGGTGTGKSGARGEDKGGCGRFLKSTTGNGRGTRISRLGHSDLAECREAGRWEGTPSYSAAVVRWGIGPLSIDSHGLARGGHSIGPHGGAGMILTTVLFCGTMIANLDGGMQAELAVD
ncbi:hypothetical protein [Rhodopirellula halodulae]|uniref:hypothetical protein n=1 Tax=Rhodopirellula halodulae TaxID=2894198 RepID=UPI001E594C01|nr:hypothetical protein [Rhodopirellula sp. JC737]